jgi:ABC-type antimicrobial peptide transport system permease subunit
MGARRGQLIRMVVGQGLRLSLIGTGAGLGVGLMMIRALRSMISNIGSADPATCAVLSTVLLTVTLAACWLPARRAANTDPMNALRED